MASDETVYARVKRLLLQRAYAEERWDELEAAKDAAKDARRWVAVSCNIDHQDGRGNPIPCPSPGQYRMRITSTWDGGLYGNG